MASAGMYIMVDGELVRAATANGITGPEGPPGADGAVVLDDLTDVDTPAPVSGDVLTFGGAYWQNTDGATLFDLAGDADTAQAAAIAASDAAGAAAAAQAASQPLDSDLTAIAALTTTSYGRGLLELANQAALQAAVAAQPLDSDLTAIAALTTTSYGRALLALADQAALTAAVAAATTSLPGIVELATDAEVQTGTDTTRAMTPASFRAFNIATLQSNDELLTTGQETVTRRMNMANTIASGSGNIRFTYFTARKSETTTQVRTFSGGTAAASITTEKIGLYTVAGNGDLTRVAVTANTTSLWIATNAIYTTSWVSSYAMVAGQRYAIGYLFVGTTAPTFVGISTVGAAEQFQDPRISAIVTGQTDCQTSYTNASLAATGAQYYAAIIP